MTLRRVKGPDTGGVYVEECFGCGCLIPRDSSGYLEVRWSPGNPGRDVETCAVRTTRAKICLTCRAVLKDAGGLVTQHGRLEIQLVELEPVGRWATRGDKFVVCRGARKVKT